MQPGRAGFDAGVFGYVRPAETGPTVCLIDQNGEVMGLGLIESGPIPNASRAFAIVSGALAVVSCAFHRVNRAFAIGSCALGIGTCAFGIGACALAVAPLQVFEPDRFRRVLPQFHSWSSNGRFDRSGRFGTANLRMHNVRHDLVPRLANPPDWRNRYTTNVVHEATSPRTRKSMLQSSGETKPRCLRSGASLRSSPGHLKPVLGLL